MYKAIYYVIISIIFVKKKIIYSYYIKENRITIQTVPVCRFCSEEALGKAMDARACCCSAQSLLVPFPFTPPH